MSIEERLEAVKKEITSIKKDMQEKKGIFLPGHYVIYYYMNRVGNVIKTVNNNYNQDDFNISIGNCFETEQECFDYKERLLVTQKLKALAEEINIDSIDWNNGSQAKYHINYNFADTRLEQNYKYSWKYLNIYSTNENFLEIAIEKIGYEKLEKLYKD